YKQGHFLEVPKSITSRQYLAQVLRGSPQRYFLEAPKMSTSMQCLKVLPGSTYFEYFHEVPLGISWKYPKVLQKWYFLEVPFFRQR
ncbi:hypothetical protein, partial [Acinetobacter baumannii]|uniref:hypothetical protein n=1 Tax=Acinetobacter baumannii TaxID=470 RepID=UPI001A7E992D